jgi:hypothetical protein
VKRQEYAVSAGEEDFQQAVDEAARGARLAWYVAECRNTATARDYWNFVGMCPLGVVFRSFPVGAPPPPRVEPRSLVQVAREYLQLVVPAVDRNPKLKEVPGAALVGFPTWFWVTDPVAVGAPTGRRTIRAEVGGVWAQVVATTTGLRVTSPAGSARCTPGQATLAWKPGRPDASACTLTFTKASVGYPGGYPVQVSTTWTATWTAGDTVPDNVPGFITGTLTGPLPELTRTATVDVPVAEVQTIVNGVRQ